MQYQILGQRGLLTLTTVGQHLPSCCLLHFSIKDKSAEVATDAKRLEEQLTSETVLSSSGPTVLKYVATPLGAQRARPSLQLVEDGNLSLLWAAMQITWFAGSTTVSVANGGSCYPECCVEALQLSALVDCHVNHVVHR